MTAHNAVLELELLSLNSLGRSLEAKPIVKPFRLIHATDIDDREDSLAFGVTLLLKRPGRAPAAYWVKPFVVIRVNIDHAEPVRPVLRQMMGWKL